MKLTVTCECGKEVDVSKSDASRILAHGHKKLTKKQYRENGRKGGLTKGAKYKKHE